MLTQTRCWSWRAQAASLLLPRLTNDRINAMTNVPMGIAFDSLIIIPSSGFIIDGNDISKQETPLNHFAGSYINRVYCFSRPITNYSGNITVLYNSNELNGTNINRLQTQVYNNHTWQALSDNKDKNAYANEITADNSQQVSFNQLLISYAYMSVSDLNNKGLIELVPLTDKIKNDVLVYPNRLPALSMYR